MPSAFIDGYKMLCLCLLTIKLKYMGYRIMKRDLSAYSLDGFDCISYYERNKDMHLDPKKICYGDVLVETKNYFSGISFKLKIFFRNHWYWKPSFHWKYGSYYFHWLFFMIWFDKEYHEKFYKIIGDHLEESKTVSNKT